MSEDFWRKKKLFELSTSEWESLCDGCGKCCLHKLEDEQTGEVYYTDVRCKLLDEKTCRCKNYLNRVVEVPSCVVLSPVMIATLQFMPKSCAYRLVHEGKDLPDWHHLVCGDREQVHRADHSVSGKTVDESTVEDWQERITEWD